MTMSEALQKYYPACSRELDVLVHQWAEEVALLAEDQDQGELLGPVFINPTEARAALQVLDAALATLVCGTAMALGLTSPLEDAIQSQDPDVREALQGPVASGVLDVFLFGVWCGQRGLAHVTRTTSVGGGGNG